MYLDYRPKAREMPNKIFNFNFNLFLLRPLVICSSLCHATMYTCTEFALTITSCTQMAGSPQNLHTMDSRSACNAQGQGQRSRDTGTFVLARKSILLAGKWMDRDQTCTRWSPDKPPSRVCLKSRSRSKVTWHRHFCAGRKIASSQRQMTGSRRQVCNLTFLQ